MSAFELFQVRGKGLKLTRVLLQQHVIQSVGISLSRTLDKKSHKSRVSFLILNDSY